MLYKLKSVLDYDVSRNGIAVAQSDHCKIFLMPLVHDLHQDCLLFDDSKVKTITYSPGESKHVPSTAAKRFMSYSHDGCYLAVSWLPLDMKAALDPSKAFVKIYRIDILEHHNKLMRSEGGDTPHCFIRFQGGCSFLPDGRLVLINASEIQVYSLKSKEEQQEILQAKHAYTVNLSCLKDKDAHIRSDYYENPAILEKDKLKKILDRARQKSNKEPVDVEEPPSSSQIFYESNRYKLDDEVSDYELEFDLTISDDEDDMSSPGYTSADEAESLANSVVHLNELDNKACINSIKQHLKNIKNGALIVSTQYRHSIWKFDKSSMQLFFSFDKQSGIENEDDEYIFSISRFHNMIIASSQVSLFKTADKDKHGQVNASLNVHDVDSGKAIAQLKLPKTAADAENQLVQVAFIQKDLYVVALTYHYHASNPSSSNHYCLNLWDVGTGTHLASKEFPCEMGQMPDSQFFINDSIQLTYGCGAFIRAYPTTSSNDKNPLTNQRITITAPCIPLMKDTRSKELFEANIHKDYYISAARDTPFSEVEGTFYIWSKSKQPSSSRRKQIPPLSIPINFLDESKTYIILNSKGNLNHSISVWKLLKYHHRNRSGPIMTIYEKKVLYVFGNSQANQIHRCLGMPAVLFDASRALESTSYPLNSKIQIGKSFILTGHSPLDDTNQTPVLVVTVTQKDTYPYHHASKKKFNSNPYQIPVINSALPEDLSYDKRKCRIAIPLLQHSMLECSLHAVINEREQKDNLSKLYYQQLFSKELCGDMSIRKHSILHSYEKDILPLFLTVAGINLFTRLARSDKHNMYLAHILRQFVKAKNHHLHMHTVVSLETSHTFTNALTEAIATRSWKNVKSIITFINADSDFINQTNYQLIEAYQPILNELSKLL